MNQNGRPRRRPEASSLATTTLTEITRRYYATAVALAKAMGLPISETFMREHRESISTCFIEAGKAGVRLPPAVQLPSLSEPPAASTNGQAPDASTTEDATLPPPDRPPADPAANGSVAEHATAVASLTTIPKDAGLPCGGQAISALKPSSLSMLLGKVGQLMHTKDRDQWVGLLAALQSERAKRMERGKRQKGEGPHG